MKNPSFVIITGPTAVGKSALAISLARQFKGEIISADSRQIYRKMDIATAKPSPEELSRVPHHLINIKNPEEDFTLADFQEKALEVINKTLEQGNLPFVVGGTVLYINSLAEGWEIPRVEPHPEFRRDLEEAAALRGSEALYEELKQVDPEAARHIIPSNTRRIIRALEVYRLTGRPFSEVQGKKLPPYRILKLGLTMDRENLYRRADHRVDKMFEIGLVEEVRELLKLGYNEEIPSMTSLGYAEVSAYLKGEISQEEAKQKMKFSTHRYIRRQYTWFRRDPQIKWFETNDPELFEKTAREITNFLNYAG